MKTKILLIFIILLAFILRFYQLGSNPSSLYWDEASLGYNAWSVVQTGKDEHGDFLPFTNFTAFGDYKPPVYIYLMAASIKLFGASDFVVRFPSAFFGVVAVACVYLISCYFFRNGRISLLAAFFIAISPWVVSLSRVAFEANVAWGLFLVGLTLFLSFCRGGVLSPNGRENRAPTIKLLLSSVFFVLPLYTFNSSRIFIPLFLVLLGIFFYKRILHSKAQFFIFYFLIFILVMPLVPHLMSKEGQLRFREVNIFTNPVPIEISNERIARDNGALWSKIINNRRGFYFMDYLKHYTDNFKFDYLFLKGDVNGTFATGRTGQLYIIDGALIVAGVIFLLAKSKKTLLFLLLWLFLGIAPAGVARETPHALRSLNALPVYQILTAAGFVFFLRKGKILIKGSLFFLTAAVFTWYLNDYYLVYAKTQGKYFQYGYRQAVDYIMAHKNEYRQIYLTSHYGRPYIYVLWYGKIPATEFLANSNVVKNEFGFYNVYRFENIYFNITDLGAGNSLLIIEPQKMDDSPNRKILEKINYPSGEPAFIIWET